MPRAKPGAARLPGARRRHSQRRRSLAYLGPSVPLRPGAQMMQRELLMRGQEQILGLQSSLVRREAQLWQNSVIPTRAARPGAKA